MERKAVKFITVFILSLVLVVTCPLLGFQSEAAVGTGKLDSSSVKVPARYGLGGIDSCTTVSFSGVCPNTVNGQRYSFYIAFTSTYVADSADYDYYLDNYRIVIGGNEYKPSYEHGSIVFQGTFDRLNLAGSRFVISADLHRIPNASLSEITLVSNETTKQSFNNDLYYYDGMLGKHQYSVLLNPTSGGSYSGYVKTDGTTSQKQIRIPLKANGIGLDGTTSGTSSGFLKQSSVLIKGGTLSLNLKSCSFDVATSVVQKVSDSKLQEYTQKQSEQQHSDAQAQQTLTQQQTDQQHSDAQTQQTLTQQQSKQQHSDAQTQLKESQKQTNAMTKFASKDAMDINSGALGDSLSGYDEAQQSIFTSSTASIEKFDIDNLFKFTANISAAILVWNNLMVSIVASMGDFSLIYTISMGLVFIGIVVGIWRYFVK